MTELKDEAEEVLDEAARGRADHTPVTVHAMVILVVGLAVAVVTAIVLTLYLAL